MDEIIAHGSQSRGVIRDCNSGLKFLIDKNLSQYLALGMQGFQENVCHLTEHLPQDVKDPVLLKHLGENNLFFITRDERIRSRPPEIEAIRKYSVGVFVLGGKNQGRCNLILQLVRNWPRIKELAGKTKKPFIFRIPPKGTKFDPLPI
jgi:hypothetical protein